MGLGYVGLPLARLLSQEFLVIGFDKKVKRINELKKGYDSNLEYNPDEISSILARDKSSKGLYLTTKLRDISQANIFIITVPTPIDDQNNPDLSLLEQASQDVGKYLKPGNIVIFESTVYPGVTEDICVPILQSCSGLEFNKDFFVGYTPERINAADKEHSMNNVTKVISASTPEAMDIIKKMYQKIGMDNVYLAPSIKVAEAVKVAENIQRDLNVALINELAVIFNLLDIDIDEVLKAAKTKWNSIDFKPGLVGGHCIPVDPYYLVKVAKSKKYHPEVILAGRKINENMPKYFADEFINRISKVKGKIQNAKVLVLGITFKENCPDIRNSKSAKLIKILINLDFKVTVYDPWADPREVLKMHGLKTVKTLKSFKFHAIIPLVNHADYRNINVAEFKDAFIYDPLKILVK